MRVSKTTCLFGGIYFLLAAILFIWLPVRVTCDPATVVGLDDKPVQQKPVELSPDEVNVASPNMLVLNAQAFAWALPAGASIRWGTVVFDQLILLTSAVLLFVGWRYRRRFSPVIRRLGDVLNHRRGVCIWLATIVLFSYFAFPPWKAVRVVRGESHIEQLDWTAIKLGRSIVTIQPAAPERNYLWKVSVDKERMVLEVLACESIVAGLYFTWGRKG